MTMSCTRCASFSATAWPRAWPRASPPESICVDPGIGFGKTLEHNLSLLRNVRTFTSLGCPVLIGVSRKSMIGIITGRPATERLAGSLALATLAVEHGAAIIRAHDVADTVAAVRVATAWMTARRDP